MQKTRKQIIDETVEFYSEDPRRRAVDEHNACVYLTEDGRKCAVGRCLEEDAPTLDHEGSISALTLRRMFQDEEFRPEYRGHPLDFWQDIQNLHDQNDNWETSGGLSESGKLELRNLYETWT